MTDDAQSGLLPELYRDMAAVEDRHWWFAGLWALVRGSVGALPAGARVLDAGCGTGGIIRRVRRWRPDLAIAGVDLSPLALGFARERGARGLARSHVETLPFRESAFDAVACLDVLYTDGVDDRAALAELARVVRPGGRCIVNVPAYDWLRGAHDVACATRHRYTAPEVRALLSGAGFVVRRVSYWNTVLLPLVVAWRLASRRGTRSDLRPAPAVVNAALGLLVRGEATLALRTGLPFGASVFAVGVKP